MEEAGNNPSFIWLKARLLRGWDNSLGASWGSGDSIKSPNFTILGDFAKGIDTGEAQFPPL